MAMMIGSWCDWFIILHWLWLIPDTKNLETHLSQLRKAIEGQKYPVIQQMKATADMLAQNNVQQKQANSQLLGYVEFLQSQGQGASRQVSLDEEKLLKLLNEYALN